MHEIIERIGWVLVHSLWQFGLIAVLTGIVMRAMRHRAADSRYAVLVASMAVLIAAPVVTAFLLPRRSPEPQLRRESAQAEASVSESPSSEVLIADRIPNVSSSVMIDEPAIDTSKFNPPVAATDLSSSSPVLSQPSSGRFEQVRSLLRPWFSWIVAGWSLGVVLCSLRPLLGWHMLRRLRRCGISPVSESIQVAMNRVCLQMGVHQSVQVLLSSLAQVPVVVGYFKPVILLPISFVTHIPPAQVEAILAHELAHVRRHDFLVNLLQTLVETLFFYHPAVWWLSKRIRIEREHCCDDLVIRVLQNRVEYGRALVAVEELRGQSSVLEMGVSDGSLLSRIRRIVGGVQDRTDFELSGRWPVALLAVVMLGFVMKVGVDSFASALPEGELRDAPEPVAIDQIDKVDVDAPAGLISSAGVDNAVAELPDGRFVEIVGITRNTRPAIEGWGPDGGMIGDVGYWPSTVVLHQQNSFAGYVENGPHPDPDDNAIDFLFRFRGLQAQPSIRFELPANGSGFQHLPVKDPYEIRVSSRWRDAALPGTKWNPPDGVVRVALTDEPWGKWLQISPRGEILNPLKEGDLYRADYNDVRVERVEPHDRSPNDLALILRHPKKKLADKYDFQIRGIDIEGKEQSVIRWDGEVIKGTDLDEGRWGLATTETKPLERYEFRLRPYRHRVTFENVSLHAGQVTKVTWKAELVPSEIADVPINRTDDQREVDTDDKQTKDATRDEPEVVSDHDEKIQAKIDELASIKNRLNTAIKELEQEKESREEERNDLTNKISQLRVRIDLLKEKIHTVIRERERFQGIWPMNLCDSEDPTLDAPQDVVKNWRWTIQGNKITWTRSEGELWHLTFSVDPAKSPREIDVTYLDGPFKGETCQGMYEWGGIDKNALLMSLQDPGAKVPRPKSFSMTSGGNTSLLFLNPRETASSLSPEFLLLDHLNVMAIRYERDGQNLVTVSTESDVRIRKWNLAEKKLISETKLDSEKHGNYFLQGQLTLSADCQRVAAMLGEHVGIWDAATGKVVRMLVMPPELAADIPRCMSCTPGLSMIASGTASKYLGGLSSPDVNAVVWDASTGQAIQTVKHAGAVQLQSVALSADGKRLATGGQRAGACVWDVSTGKLLFTLPNENFGRRHPDEAVSEEGANQVLCLRFSPDGKLLAMGDMLGVKLIDTQSGQLKHQLDAPFRLGRSGLVFSRDGKLLARTATDKVVPIWSTQTGKLLAEIPTEAHDASFSAEGDGFAVAFTDAEKAVSVWRLERDFKHLPDEPSKTGMRISRPDAEGRFSVFFDNPIDEAKPGRWILDPEKHQVIFQIFVKTAEGRLQEKIFKQLTADPQGGYRVDAQVPPDLFEYSTVSATFVTFQPDHETWVSNFFQRGMRTSYTGIWASDSGLLLRTKLDSNLNGWPAAVESGEHSSPSVKGRVMIDGPIPVVPPLKVKIGLHLVIPRNEADERRNDEHEKNTPVTEIPDESLVISKEGGIANVAIYLKKAPVGWKPTDPPQESVELRSSNHRFSPRVSLLRVGQPLQLVSPNTEADNFQILPLRSNAIGYLVPPDSVRMVDALFTNPEKYPTRVDSILHFWQRAWLLGLDHPFAAITDSEGRFEIRDLPSGEHHFIVWHEIRGPINKDLVIRVEPGKVAEVDLMFKVEQLKPDAPRGKRP